MSTVDPVQFGELIGSVKSLTTQVKTLTEKVESLENRMSTGKGVLIGLFVLAGGAGAGAHELILKIMEHTR